MGLNLRNKPVGGKLPKPPKIPKGDKPRKGLFSRGQKNEPYDDLTQEVQGGHHDDSVLRNNERMNANFSNQQYQQQAPQQSHPQGQRLRDGQEVRHQGSLLQKYMEEEQQQQQQQQPVYQQQQQQQQPQTEFSNRDIEGNSTMAPQHAQARTERDRQVQPQAQPKGGQGKQSPKVQPNNKQQAPKGNKSTSKKALFKGSSSSLSESSVKSLTTMQIIKDSESKLAFTQNFLSDFARSKLESLRDLDDVVSQATEVIITNPTVTETHIPEDLTFGNTGATNTEPPVVTVGSSVTPTRTINIPTEEPNVGVVAPPPPPPQLEINIGSEVMEEEIIEEALGVEQVVERNPPVEIHEPQPVDGTFELTDETVELADEAVELADETVPTVVGAVTPELDFGLVSEEAVTPVGGAVLPTDVVNTPSESFLPEGELNFGQGEEVPDFSVTQEPQVVQQPVHQEHQGVEVQESAPTTLVQDHASRMQNLKERISTEPLDEEILEEELVLGSSIPTAPLLNNKTFNLDVEKSNIESRNNTIPINTGFDSNDLTEGKANFILNSAQQTVDQPIKGFEDALRALGGN